MKRCLPVFLVFLVLPAISATWAPGVARAQPDAALDGAIEGYVEAWKSFYPSRALRHGFFDAVESFEDRSAAAVTAWIELNHEALASLEAISDLSLDDHIDRRLLLARIRGELDRWGNDRPHETSPGMYAGLIEGAVAPVLDSSLWSGAEKERLVTARLRAYTSVQAHCNGWSEERVRAFSIDTSLLAPQFAASLWGRLMRSPMQIITYMLGGLELRALYEAEQARQGDAFETRAFMDTILRTGPVPSEELAAVLAAERP